MRSSLFWVVTLRVLVVVYRGFGTAYRPYIEETMSPFLNSLTLEDGTGTLSRNVDTQLPAYAAYHLRKMKILPIP
jgi:hypothetical protein